MSYNDRLNNPLNHAATAFGELVVMPTAASIHTKMFVRAGMRNPVQVRDRSVALARAMQLQFGLMLLTGLPALFFCWFGAYDVANHTDVNFGLWLIGISVAWLWVLRVINGAILHWFLRDLPVQLYHYVWYWPTTPRTTLRLTHLPSMLKEPGYTTQQRFVIGFSTISWALVVKLPLYAVMGYTAVSLFRGLLPVG